MFIFLLSQSINVHMIKNLNVFYWSPYTSKVATIRAVLNSARSLQKYSKGKVSTKIIDALGEWKEHLQEIKNNNIGYSLLINKTNFKIKDKTGFFKSRFYFFVIFYKCFFPLKNLIIKEKPEYLIIHLLTSLTMFLNLICNFKTKIILRISGLPQMNLFRKFFWKIAISKIHLVTCPTEATRIDMINLNICNKDKIVVLKDPIINVKKIIEKKNSLIEKIKFKDYFLSIGRLTPQKNFLFLIKTFKIFLKERENAKLIIIGDGEQKNEIQKFITKNNLENNIILTNYKKNVFPYIKNAKCFILSSLWEDPGFVIIESAFCNIPIISSNCKNGPSEILTEGKSGFLFNTNSKEDFLKKIIEFENSDKDVLKEMIYKTKRNIKEFSMFSHFKNLRKIIF